MNRKLLIIVIYLASLGVIALPSSAATEPSLQPSPADVVLQNGRIYAGKSDNPWLSAVAVKGGKFVYTGHDAANFIGPKTKVYDLSGKTVIPGIIDAHSHPGSVALSGNTLLLDESSTKSELIKAVKKLVAENKDRQVLIGGYWENALFDVTGPRKEVLDAIEPTRPLILYDAWAHTVWANSAALKQAGVTRDTKDLVPGFSFYQKSKNGEPTGWITESAASVFINKFHSITPEVQASLLAYLQYYRDIGVTTVLDAGNFGMDRQVFAAVSQLDKKGLLPIRYHGAYTLFKPDDLDDAVKTLKKLGDDFNSEKVRIDTLKIFFDGVIETRTAAMSHDYYDTPGNSGDTLLSQEQVHKLILELEAGGLNLHVHAVGDRAVTTILNAVEAAHKTLSQAPNIRITICHLEVVKETDFPRFKKLGVIANFTPHWTIGGDLTRYEQGVGKSAFEMQRSQPLISDGAVVTFSSDITDAYEWKNDRANPYLGIQVGHNRQDVGVEENGLYMPPMSERLQRRDLVDGYTTNAAYQLGREEEIGLIGVGKQADLIVLDQNIFEVDRYSIHKTKPLAVMVGGNLVSGSLR